MQWILQPFRRWSDIAGRSRRIEFWLFWLVALILQMIASYLDAANGQASVVSGMGPVTLAITLLFLLPASAVGIRRLHDTGRNGWWMLLFAAPYVGWLVSVENGSDGLIAAVALLLGCVVLLVLLVQPGQIAENRYGLNPKAGIAAPVSGD